MIVALALLAGLGALQADGAAAADCGVAANPIACENAEPGNPPEQWDVEGSGDPSIQGFATEISVERGETVHFKVKTEATKYRLDIYRMGYYGGDGARLIETVEPSAALPQVQPEHCESEPSTGLVDCGNWAESASWAVPADAVSGIYFAKLVREDQPSEGSQVIFVVRDDESDSDVLFQTSDATWEAYNSYGGNSLYEGGPGIDPGRAYKVSYNRPLTTRGSTPEDSPFGSEYPMVRWLERNGYDVSYSTGVDTDERGAELLDHKVFLSVGHDEYWSGQQRANVEAARDAGVNLAFFSGNEVFWKTRWEDSIDGSGGDHRTLVCFKETHANEKIDPEASVWTGSWADPRFSPPADGGRPQNQLTGTLFAVNTGTARIEVPAADGKLRLWRGTSVASLEPGERAALGERTLGYEWDEDADNGFRPAGLMDLSTTSLEVPQKLIDYGSNYDAGPATHHLTMYRAPSGALVFGAGTVQWSWGLDGNHDQGDTVPDHSMQQATVNLLADMGTQPGELQPDLAAAAESSDTEPPSTTIGSPADGGQVESGKPTTITGIANDATGEVAGGQVAGVEVSTDGGARWHPAIGRDQWSYTWRPGKTGNVTIEARAVDDSGNLDSAGDQVSVEVTPHTCPCSIWDDSLTAPEEDDGESVELGVKFRSDVAGFITGLRFYKTGGNTGTHVGHLWTASGTLLAEASFHDETATGWQQVSFDEPVAIEADTTYVASYHAPQGHYAAIGGYFSLVGADSAPLHALAEGVDGANGVFRYGPSGGLFSGGGPQTFQAANYLVDVVFDEQVGQDESPPKVTFTSPAANETGVSPGAALRARFSEAIRSETVSAATVALRDESGDPVPASVSYNDAGRDVVVQPLASLHTSTTYTMTVKGGPGGITDPAGNPLAADLTWSFATAAPPPPPPDQGPGGPILVISNAANPFSAYYAEILRAEGLNEFDAADISTVTRSLLDAHQVAILGEGPLSAGEAAMVGSWVNAGGNLIAMRPDPKLAGLLGLQPEGGALANAYLKVDTGTAAGHGIVGQTIQFHGTADRYAAKEAETIATLYSDPSTATSSPAVTLRSVGTNGGQAAAFSYDLARSVVYTRQGNPAWAGEDRDGIAPTRSDDLFFGAKEGDPQPDWVNLEKVAIPQADEQQRLLTNLVERMNAKSTPLPRFWFLPRDEKAAVVMSGDDHAGGGTIGRFNQYEDDSPSGCSVANWECVRSTSYIFPETQITDSQAAAYTAAGFEIGLHTLTNCFDWTSRQQLEGVFSSQLETLRAKFPSLPAPVTNRTHCIVWSDWASQPKVELQNGIRMDTDYYYWPGTWVQNRPGMFTGSGMPMRFADTDGSMIDVYQAATQMTDESEQAYPFTVDTLLDNALGPDGYYGVFTANMHTDDAASADSDAVIESAQARGVPVVSARQMLTWLDGRNRSSFGSLERSGDRLDFTIDRGEGANGLRAMLPITAETGELLEVRRGGVPVATSEQTIKGIEYAFFDADSGSYSARYGATVPSVTIDSGPSGPTGSAQPGFGFHGDPGVSFECSIDSGDPEFRPCSGAESDLPSAALADGPHVFRVRATNSEGNRKTATRSFSVDATAPETSIGDAGPSDPTSSVAASFTFSGSDGTGAGVASFQCRLDSAQAADWAACASPKSYDALADGLHSFEVRAIDAVGNGDPTPAVRSWRVDTTAPETEIADPRPANPTNSTSASFSFSGTDPAGSGVASFQCSLDEASFAACASPQSYDSLAEGPHGFRVRAIDAAGNADGSPASFAWSVDTNAPTVAIDSLSTALIGPAGSTEVHWHADENGAFELRVGGSDCSAGTVLDSGSYTSHPGVATSLVTEAELAEGANTLRLCLTDAAANTGGATVTAKKDTTAPETEIADPRPANPTNSTSASFSFSGTDPAGSGVASFQCSLDEASFAACASPQSYDSLAEGPHGFRVRAIDAAGNADGTPASFAWTVDTTAPAVAIDSGPAGLGNDPSPTFVFHADPGAALECSIDSGSPAFAPCSAAGSHIPASPLADGDYTFRVRATDFASNQSTATRAFSVDTAIPAAPELTSTDPVSPANSNSIEIEGTAEAGTTVAIYAGGDCSGPPVATGTAAGLAGGITVLVGDDSSSSFRATATSAAGNTSPCSSPIAYVEDSTAPQTEIADPKPSDPSNSTAASFSFSGTDPAGSGVASFQCSLDEASFAACASPQSYDSLAEGPHGFRVRAIDAAGNADGTPASFAWTVDTNAPTVAIDSGPAGLSNDPTPTFAFHGDPGVTFECSIDSGGPAFSPCSAAGSHSPASPLADGAYTFRVRATDSASNQSTATRAFSVDTAIPAAPELTSTDPASPANQNSPKVFGSAPAGSSVDLYSGPDCSGGPVATGTAAGLAGGITVLVGDDSSFSFRATATSAAGNTSPCSSPIAYVEDSTAPQTAIDSGPVGTVETAATVFAFSSEPGASFQCSLDDAPFAACASPQSYDSLAEGPHGFQVRAVDGAGNADPSPAQRDFTVDTSAPAVAIDSLTKTLLGPGQSSLLSFHAEKGGTFKVRVGGSDCDSGEVVASGAYGGQAAIETATIDSADLAEGANTIRVCLTAGSAAVGAATTAITRDTLAPDTGIDSQPAATSSSSAAEFDFSGSDPGGAALAGFECRLDAAAFAPCDSPIAYAAIADGQHEFAVRATDLAGNVDPSPAEFSWAVDTTKPEEAVEKPRPTEEPRPAETPGPAETPLARLRLIKVIKDGKHGTAIVLAETNAAGNLSVSTPVPARPGGKAPSKFLADRIRQQIARGIEPRVFQARGPGQARLPIKLKPAGRKLLREGRGLKVRVRVDFEAADGSKASKAISLKLRSKLTPR